MVIWSWQDASEYEDDPESAVESPILPKSLREQSSDVLSVGPIFPLELPPLNSYVELIERPLFNSTRRPVRSTASILEEKLLLDEYVLVGIINDFRGRRAVLRDHQEQVTIVTSGDELQGWEVESVQSDRITFRNSDHEKVISFVKMISSPPDN